MGVFNVIVACMHVIRMCQSTLPNFVKCKGQWWSWTCREFAEYLNIVRDPERAKVVAVTSAERAEAALKERPGFFDEVTRIL